jgi:hypothetical protein
MNHEGHKGHEAIDRRTELTAREAIDAGLKVHKSLGPGLLESAYEHCLAHELITRGLSCRRQVGMPIVYGSETLDAGYRLDLLIDELVHRFHGTRHISHVSNCLRHCEPKAKQSKSRKRVLDYFVAALLVMTIVARYDSNPRNAVLVIVEVKSVDALAPIHEAQLLTYLKLSGLRLGLLMNFNVVLFKHGLKRMVL